MSGHGSRECIARIVEAFRLQLDSILPEWRADRDKGYYLLRHPADNRFLRLEFWRIMNAGVGVEYGLTFGAYPAGDVDLDYPIPKKIKRPYILVTDQILGFENEFALEYQLESIESTNSLIDKLIPEYFNSVSRPCLEKLVAVASRIGDPNAGPKPIDIMKDAQALLTKNAIAALDIQFIPNEGDGDVERFAAFLRMKRDVLAKSAYAATVKYMQSLPDICRDPDINDYLGGEVPLKDLVALRNAVVAPLGDGFEFVLVYDCEWDPEHGFSILFRGDKAVEASLELDADLTYRVASSGKHE